jgi:long-chain acyl-CoA synthetase
MERINIRELVDRSADKFADLVAYQIKSGSEYRSFSYLQVKATVAGIQARLTGSGISKGDRVALISENRPEWAMAYLAIAAMGAIVVPLDAMLLKEDLSPLLEDCEPKAVIASQKFTDHFRGTKYEAIVLWMEEFGRLEQTAKMTDVEIGMDDTASLVYTSGTTGYPKGVMLTHRSIMWDAIAAADFTFAYPGDNFLSVVPLHHTFETTAGFIAPFYKGCCVTYAESLKAPAILQNMQETGVVIMGGVPMLFQLFYDGIMRQAEEKKIKPVFIALMAISKLFISLFNVNIGRHLFAMVHKKFGGKIRFFITGGAAADMALFKSMEALGFILLQGYGLTETSPIIAINNLRVNRFGAVGKPLQGVEVKIDGAEKSGEILVRGPIVMKGYYRRPDLTAEVIKDGWLHTGDIGYIDSDGFLYVTGRLKNVIVSSSGLKVYPEEVEVLFAKLPQFKEYCVMGMNIRAGARQGTEEVGLVAVPNEGFGEDQIRQAVNEVNGRLAAYKRITRIIVSNEELPKTRLKKVKRFELKKQLTL